TAALRADDEEPTIEFNRDIRPILSENCFACHGPDPAKRESGLRFDVEDDSKRELDSGDRAIVPGDPQASALLARVTSDDEDVRMPPLETEKRLTEQQIDLLRRWIADGAPWQGHWAYQPIRRPPLAEVSLAEVPPGEEPLGAIDTYILARLEREKLEPSPTADRVTLLRRLSFDLVGLPPTPAEVDAFVADESPDAVERAIDRLLAAPQYGEHMAVYWLDLVRYADSCGYHSDNDQPISPYRDYVIAAFNANMPFDQFTREQLAGDLLPSATLAQRVATGYNRLNKTTEEGGAQAAEYIEKYAADRVRTTAGVWLAQTLGCAECHDHKYDPISTRDFYSFAAFFADVKETGTYLGGRREPEIPVPTPIEQQRLDDLQAQIAAIDGRLESATPDDLKTNGETAASLKQRRNRLAAERTKIEKQLNRTMVTVSVPPREMRVLPRGNWQDRSGPVVSSALPESLAKFALPNTSSLPPRESDRLSRLDLANWIVAADNPLPARVLANRLWKMFHGVGLSKRLDDFGVQGEWPTHPKLLDCLAAELLDSHWDVKHVVRKIVSSRTYRQSSVPTQQMLERDPLNRLVARQGRWRLEAEVVRDNALAVSGLLSFRIGGRSVKPYQPAGYWQHLNFPQRTWKADVGENQYRRGLYTHWQRTYLHPSLLALDATPREECTAERPTSNTPKAALALLNDPTYVEAARALAVRVLRETADNDAATTDSNRIRYVWREVLSRRPTDAETQVVQHLLADHAAYFRANPAAAAKLIATGQSAAPADLPPTDLAAWTSVARTLLNLQEATTRN
ncbi:MAG: PSD1 and planctomycete cytochrome C domain-containing protein, partial [Pirellulales bacterium]